MHFWTFLTVTCYALPVFAAYAPLPTEPPKAEDIFKRIDEAQKQCYGTCAAAANGYCGCTATGVGCTEICCQPNFLSSGLRTYVASKPMCLNSASPSATEGFILIRIEASCPAECLLEHDDPERQTIPFERRLRLGGVGTVLRIHEKIRGLGLGDVVLACLSGPDITTDARGDEVASVHQSLVCKLSPNAPNPDAARIPMAFAIATILLHTAGIMPLPLRPIYQNQQEDTPSKNVLLISSDTVLPLMVIKLLCLYTASSIFVVYEPATSGRTTSIDPAMIAGAHFAQQPSSTSDPWEVARGLRSNLGHYGPYSGKDCFDLVLDLTGKRETPEPYQRVLCPDIGRLLQLPPTLRIDFEWLFAEKRIMEELGNLLEKGEIESGLLSIIRS
ncbi:hypothetical protein M409DRAFT_59023 [Zasmidium cellare ATCC 36951]|uniref:Alcohol dehydrogenase N-terminal domain-containing protein n=1 Tax=Zasmidium cellare ATCC 36951 TaxID=1080233 RepID=A0A6A6C616_ZASCE|nr:uncharacterized protein M409DRAFT_59023 [Zasmidium cellare ATCC 36951]KAF2161640.1 hypothetical protein M409DRAFT_59023 [Zasmidium cellare ATCC 36951]